MNIAYRAPFQSSYYFPFELGNFYWTDNYGFDNTMTKFSNLMSHLKFTLFLDFFLFTDGNMHPDLRNGWIHKPGGGVVFGFGIEGFRDRVQSSSNEAVFYPAVPSQSYLEPNFNETMKLD